MDTIGTTVSCPACGGVLNAESLNVHMSMQRIQMGQSSGLPLKEVTTFQTCSLIEVPLQLFLTRKTVSRGIVFHILSNVVLPNIYWAMPLFYVNWGGLRTTGENNSCGSRN